MTVMRCGYLNKWIADVRKTGIKEFKLRDLPKELQIKGMTRKARSRGIIEKVRDVRSHSIWRFIDNGKMEPSNNNKHGDASTS